MRGPDSTPTLPGTAWVHGGHLAALKRFGDSVTAEIFFSPEGLDYERDMVALYLHPQLDAPKQLLGEMADALEDFARIEEGVVEHRYGDVHLGTMLGERKDREMARVDALYDLVRRAREITGEGERP